MKFDPARAINTLTSQDHFGGVNPSITDSSTFTFSGAKVMLDVFEGTQEGCFLYSRHWNPMNRYLSDALAALEDTESAWVTASGMAAITNAVLQICDTGDHIVCSRTIYGGTFAFMTTYLRKFKIDVTLVDTTDLESVRHAIRPNTKMVYTEAITNPLLQVSDIPALAEIAHAKGLLLVVDNTFSPMMLSPAKLGADVVVHSLTKFINGSSDCIAGAICASKAFVESLIDVHSGTSMLLGPALDPVRSASILKNIHTLHLRMKQHSRNALFMAQNLKEMGLIITYPGLPEHPGHELLKSMMNEEFGFGGMMSIDLKTTDKAWSFMESLQRKHVGYLAVSLGFYKTLFSNSGNSTSSELPAETQAEMGLSPGLVRFSIGLDNDIEHTLELFKESLREEGIL